MLLLLLGTGLSPGPARGQASGAAQEPVGQDPEAQVPTFTSEVAVSHVLVPVLVRSGGSGGEYVRDLSQEDFELRIDGHKVAVESFESRNDAPVSVVFLQDLSGSMGTGGRLAASRETFFHFLSSSGPGDELALATFGGGSTLVDVPFTTDHSVIWEAIDGWEAYGTTALHDAVAQLPRISGSGRYAKRAAVVITDGVDNASELPPVDARDIVRRSEVPVYVLGLGSGDPYRLDRRGEKLYRYSDVLNLLASYTGGTYFPVSRPAEMKEAIVQILAELRHQYVLGFTTSGAGPVGQHQIEVTVVGPAAASARDRGGRRGQLRTLARQGYRGTAPATAPQ